MVSEKMLRNVKEFDRCYTEENSISFILRDIRDIEKELELFRKKYGAGEEEGEKKI